MRACARDRTDNRRTSRPRRNRQLLADSAEFFPIPSNDLAYDIMVTKEPRRGVTTRIAFDSKIQLGVSFADTFPRRAQSFDLPDASASTAVPDDDDGTEGRSMHASAS